MSCSPTLTYYPVRGRHNNGYDSTAGNSSQWTCDDAHSNSDFVGGDHLGNDIWAAEGTPVVATRAGTATLVGFSSYSGNKVTIADSCGYYHFNAHLKSIAPGITNGKHIAAGTVIGYVGKTGTASNGVIHLHYSIYPAGNYDAGINPYSYLHAVEHNVCNIPGTDPPPPPPPPHGADVERVVAARDAAGELHVLWTDDAGAIQHAWHANAGWATAPLGGSAKELALATNADGRLELFYAGTNDQLYHRAQAADGTWGDEQAFGVAARDLAIGRNGDGRLELFFADANLAIQHTWQSAPGGAWSAVQALGGSAKDLAVGNNADGRLEVFYVGTNDQLFHRVQIATGWSGEIAFGFPGRDLAVGRNGDGRLELFFTAPDDSIRHTWQTAPNDAWAGAAVLGGKAEQLVVGNNADGRLEIFYIGTNQKLYHRAQITSGWSAELATNLPATKLDISRNADGRLEVFYLTPTQLHHTWQLSPNAGWSGGTALIATGRNMPELDVTGTALE